ncbi:MAG: cytidine deaminase [Acidobacteriota bacterium]|jgi:cytidine deaminase
MDNRHKSDLDEAARRLIDQAKGARANAHAPYSGFAVGAAVRCARGNLFLGCNVEISSYSLTMCAERVALFAARAAGSCDIEAIAVVGPGDGGTPTPPCGACRQVIWDLAPDAVVYLATPDGAVQTWAAAELLPEPFGPRQLDAPREEPS